MRERYVIIFYGLLFGFTFRLWVWVIWPFFFVKIFQFVALKIRRHRQSVGRIYIRFLETVRMHREFHSFLERHLPIRNHRGLFSYPHLFVFFTVTYLTFLSQKTLSLWFILGYAGKSIGYFFIFIRVFMIVGSFVFTLLGRVNLTFLYWLFTFWLNWPLDRAALFKLVWYLFW